ncbi:MAG: TfoX/Sxy family protein [Cryobacterium sp.]
MSTDPQTVAFIEDQLAGLNVRTLRMFGEFGIYCDEKIVGLICDDALFLKPSSADPALFTRTAPAPPYEGAKEYHRVPGDALEDRAWLGRAVQATADALPAPTVKKPAVKKPAVKKPTVKTPKVFDPTSLPPDPGGMQPHPRRPGA